MGDDVSEAAEASLAEETYGLLLADIISTRLTGGSVIQQRRLASQYAVSRSPMRHALSRLEGEGLIVRDERGILCVRVISLKDYLDSLTMRMLLEPTAAALAAPGADEEQVVRLLSDLEAIEADPEPDAEDVWRFDDALHGFVAAHSDNPFMSATISEMRRYTTIFERQMALIRAKPGVTEHRQILVALAAHDPERARKAMAAHLEIVRQGVLTNY
jgi:DNA-binding GntR family transcriptional regulator